MEHDFPSRFFSDSPNEVYVCPQCKKGELVPQVDSFSYLEPAHSRQSHDHEAWEVEWVSYRFSFKCVCSRADCSEIAFAIGSGSVDRRYDEHGESEYYEDFRIRAFYPSPYLVMVPEAVPDGVVHLLEKSFALYWVDTSAASNALRASLEALLDELKVPKMEKNANGKDCRLNLHRRIEIWSGQQSEYADLCYALKDVGNLGSHGEVVQEAHYQGVLKIYAHVLDQLYNNNAKKMKQLAQEIRSAIKTTSDI